MKVTGTRVVLFFLLVSALDALVWSSLQIKPSLTKKYSYTNKQPIVYSVLKLSNDNIYDNFSDGVFESDRDKDSIETGLTIRRNKIKKGDRRDMLPFEIYILNDETTSLGSYLLDSTTACGDLVDLGTKGVFVVKRVIFVYKYTQGALRVFKKKLHLSSTNNESSSLLFGSTTNKKNDGDFSNESSFQ